jgi:hypothetical protein
MMLDCVYANRGCENCQRENIDYDRNWCEQQIVEGKCELAKL